MHIGLDIGSTTIKAAVLDELGNVVYSSYQRHYSQVISSARMLLQDVRMQLNLHRAYIAVSGSAGMGLAEACSMQFVQEVHAAKLWAQRTYPESDVIIELGGEDAKIVFLQGVTDARMNGTCAGGTGAFIDQMATLLGMSLEQLNEAAGKYERIYTIASRCGVFAKSDIQPLLNQGVSEADIAASIFSAVVNQTVAGLAQGRPIAGQVLYLGGPLTFLSALRESFDRTLGLEGICPEQSLCFVALGTASAAGQQHDLEQLQQQMDTMKSSGHFVTMPALFTNELDYATFRERHDQAKVARADLVQSSEVYLGIDAGSTTVKFAVIDGEGRLLLSHYQSNNGNPVPLVRGFIQRLYKEAPWVTVKGSAVTGYGEDLIRNAFRLDYGLVETVAHFTAARQMIPEVDFILDIGGQDMKCLHIHRGVIDNIFLNEACSSGCGSFLQTFANALGHDIADFAQMGLFAQRPVDLGSRCTVFMNSSVKQAQKDGASLEDISAGLSMSVVKNAIYKVIRPASTHDLGQHIVVQGGTFYNDAVLRAFELELECDVVRPDIAGLMGAYGAALYALEQGASGSTIVSSEELEAFSHDIQQAVCKRCSNNCRLTINVFKDGRRFISGNRCQAPITQESSATETLMNIYQQKRDILLAERNSMEERPTIGIPLGLNLYELLPFWQTFFDALGFDVVTSPLSTRELYLSGQSTIPSDTVCFPAKLMHGHIQSLIDQGITTIFYPCMSYNIDDRMGDNNYNCPIVAYYPEVINANMLSVRHINFIHGYVGLHRPQDVAEKLWQILVPHVTRLTQFAVSQAVSFAYRALEQSRKEVLSLGAKLIAAARQESKPIIVLAGRPYHIDPEICHGIDKMITGMGFAVISEDALPLVENNLVELQVLNQWTYHSRLYTAAQYVTEQPDMQFVQLVSFGCGCDAITTDECRRILEQAGKIYTQIKIDEIENLGAARIRLRSLFAAAGYEHRRDK